MSNEQDEASAHPSENQLRRFVEGRLSETNICKIEKHIETCEACCKLISTFHGKDALSLSIREALNDSTFGTQHQPQKLNTDRIERYSEKSFGRFQLLEEIGIGGFGIVWLANDPKLNRKVALKIPKTGQATSAELLKRFLREAKAAAALEHPNIVRIYESGEVEGVCFIASEYCHGSDLKRWLQSHQRLQPRQAAWLLLQICRAVEYAHREGVLHRDLKPANVLLFSTTREPKTSNDNIGFIPKVADFGLAKFESDEDETGTRVLMGSASYMAPEQAVSPHVTPLADIYSLGCIAYELLAGRVPHEGGNELATIELARHNLALAPDQIRKDLPRDLSTICMKCLQIEPNRRYESVSELIGDLSSFLAGKPISARPVSWPERLLLWSRRKPWVASVWGLLIVTLVGLIGFVSALKSQNEKIRVQLAQTEQAQQQTKLALFESELQKVRLGRLGTQTGRRFEGLEAATKAVSLLGELNLNDDYRLSLRNEAIACLSLFDLKLVRQQASRQTPTDMPGIAIDRLHDRYAISLANGDIEIRNSIDNTLFKTISNPDAKVSGRDDWRLLLKFSPNGRYLATSGNRNEFGFCVWDLEQDVSRVFSLETNSATTYSEFCFTPDSRHIVFQKPAIVFLNLASGKVTREIESNDWRRCLAISCDNRRLALANEEIEIVDLDSGKRQTFYESESSCFRVAWHPTNPQILAFNDGTRLYIGDVTKKNGDNLEPLDQHSGSINSISYSQDGRLIVTSAWDGATCVWDLNQRSLVLKADLTASEFSQDDMYLNFGTSGTKFGRWQVAHGKERRLLKHQGDIRTIGFALEGRLLITAGEESLSTWDAKNGTLIHRSQPGIVESAWAAPDHSSLWLAGPNGLFKIPTQVQIADSKVQIRLLPAQPISAAGNNAYRLSSTPNGDRLAVSRVKDTLGFAVIDTKTNERTGAEMRLRSVHYHAISPDGRFSAISTWNGYQCRVFEIKTGKQVASFEALSSFCRFSPNGKWLVIGDGRRFQVIEVSNWQVKQRIDRGLGGANAPLDFDDTAGLAVLCVGHREIKLFETENWTELAMFSVPSNKRIRELALSRKGDRLAVSNWDDTCIIWDLKKIREGLKELGLDWAAPKIERDSRFESATSIVID